jgi:hypothetical protein
MQAPSLSPQQQQQQAPERPTFSGGTAASSDARPGSAASTGRQSSFGDVSSGPSSSHPAVGSSSDPGLQGNLFGTAANAAAAAQAAAAGTGGGLLWALGGGADGQQEQLYEAAAMAYPNAFRPTQQLEEKLPEIQAVHKRVMLQLMPLLLQVRGDVEDSFLGVQCFCESLRSCVVQLVASLAALCAP